MVAPALRRLALTLALMTPAAPALAYHDDRPTTDPSAYTLRQAEFRLGLWRFEAGATDDILLGTYPLLWLLRIVNLHVKWAFLRADDFTLAASTGIFSLNGKNLPGDDPPDVKFRAFPLYLVGSYDLGTVRLHLGIGYTYVSGAGDTADQEGGTSTEGLAALSTAQIVPTLELHLDRVFAFIIESHISLFQSGGGGVSTVYEPQQPPQIAGRARVVFHGSGDADLASGFQGNVVASAHWALDSFNLRLGLGYGHFTLPTVNLFVEKATVIPDFAIYWRF